MSDEEIRRRAREAVFSMPPVGNDDLLADVIAAAIRDAVKDTKESCADAAFVVLARNAFDTWLRHPDWSVEACQDKEYRTWWRVLDGDGNQVGEPQVNPYSALTAAGEEVDGR